jgi:hypothetical protein
VGLDKMNLPSSVVVFYYNPKELPRSKRARRTKEFAP